MPLFAAKLLFLHQGPGLVPPKGCVHLRSALVLEAGAAEHSVARTGWTLQTADHRAQALMNEDKDGNSDVWQELVQGLSGNEMIRRNDNQVYGFNPAASL